MLSIGLYDIQVCGKHIHTFNSWKVNIEYFHWISHFCASALCGYNAALQIYWAHLLCILFEYLYNYCNIATYTNIRAFTTSICVYLWGGRSVCVCVCRRRIWAARKNINYTKFLWVNFRFMTDCSILIKQ